jgi:phosphatidylserine decarboxylase
MLLSRYGLREWLSITLITAIAACGFALLAWRVHPAWWWALVPVALIWLALVAFFRDPIRRVPRDLPPEVMLSPADGTISAIVRVDRHEAISGQGPALIIRIFLSVLDVHVNRWPCDGTVVAMRYREGTFYDARTEQSAITNESNLIVMRLRAGATGDETIGVRQVSGAIARRIVCPVAVGDHAVRGERFGMIKFGSTTELILPRPDDVQVHVREGQKVKGGLTALATLKSTCSPRDL